MEVKSPQIGRFYRRTARSACRRAGLRAGLRRRAGTRQCVGPAQWSVICRIRFGLSNWTRTKSHLIRPACGMKAAALSMTGVSRRLIRIRDAGNNLSPVMERFLDDHAGDALIVIEAGDLAKSSSLRQVVCARRQCRSHCMLSRQ